jgi:hypothetical protein
LVGEAHSIGSSSKKVDYDVTRACYCVYVNGDYTKKSSFHTSPVKQINDSNKKVHVDGGAQEGGKSIHKICPSTFSSSCSLFSCKIEEVDFWRRGRGGNIVRKVLCKKKGKKTFFLNRKSLLTSTCRFYDDVPQLYGICLLPRRQKEKLSSFV